MRPSNKTERGQRREGERKRGAKEADFLIPTPTPDERLQEGRVRAVLEPIPVKVFGLMMKQASVGSSPTGSPVDIAAPSCARRTNHWSGHSR